MAVDGGGAVVNTAAGVLPAFMNVISCSCWRAVRDSDEDDDDGVDDDDDDDEEEEEEEDSACESPPVTRDSCVLRCD